LDVTSIKNFRLVCRKWDVESQDIFLLKTQLDLCKLKPYEESKLFQVVNNGTCLPYKNIAIILNRPDFRSYKSLKKLDTFLQPLKSTITTVSFHSWRVPGEKEQRVEQNAFYTVLATVENLQFLSITHIPPESLRRQPPRSLFQRAGPSEVSEKIKLNNLKTLRIYKGMGCAPHFLEELLSCSPNIKNLILFKVYNSTVSAVLQILLKLGVHNLTSLEISYAEILLCGPMKFQLKALLQANYNLERLEINLNSWEFYDLEEDDNELKNYYYSLLLKHSRSLRKLKLTHRDNYRRDYSSDKLIRIPELPQLRHLTLEHCCDFGDLGFLGNTPRLYSLRLGFKEPWTVARMNDTLALQQTCLQALTPSNRCGVISNLKCLWMPAQLLVPVSVAFDIIKITPFLTKLSFRPARDECMFLIYKYLSSLNELEILQGSGISDQGIVNGCSSTDQSSLLENNVYSILNLKSKSFIRILVQP